MPDRNTEQGFAEVMINPLPITPNLSYREACDLGTGLWSCQLLYSLYDVAQVGIYVTDEQGYFVEVNQAYCDLCGYGVHELLGQPVTMVLPPQIRDQSLEVSQLLLTDTPNVERKWEIQNKQGHLINVEVTTTRVTTPDGRKFFVSTVTDVTEYRHTLSALQASEAELRSLLAAMTDVIIVLDDQGRYLKIAPTNYTHLYKPPEELLGKTIAEIFDPPQATEFLQAIHTCLNTQKTINLEYSLIIDGQEMWFAARLSPISPKRLIWMARDITLNQLQTQAEHRLYLALQESEARYAKIFEEGPLGMALLGLDGHFLEANHRFCQLVGYTESELRLLTFQDLTHPEDRTDYALEPVLTGENHPLQWETRYLDQDQALVWVSVTASLIRDEHKQPLYVLIMVEDIRHRKDAEAALRLSDRALAAISNGVIITDAQHPDNPVIYCNKAFEEITGYSKGEIIGRNCQILQGPDTDPESLAMICQAVQQQQECQVILKNYRKDGTCFWNKLSIAPVRDDRGNLTHFIGVQSDVSIRIHAEQALLEAHDQLKTVLDAVPGIVSWMSADLCYLGVNRHLADLYNLPPEAFIGKDIGFLGASPTLRNFMEEFFASDNTEAVLELCSHVGVLPSTVSNPKHPQCLITDAPPIKYYLVVAQKYNQGQAAFTVGIDITERKQAEAELLRISKAVESCSDAISIADVNGVHRYQNRAFSELFEYESVDALRVAGGITQLFVHPAIAQTVLEQISRGESWSGEVLQKSRTGRVIHILLRADAIKDSSGKLVGFIGIATNITKRKQAEIALRQSEQRFRALIENGTDLILILDQYGVCQYVSPSQERMLGYHASEIIGKSICNFIHPCQISLVCQVLKSALKNPGVGVGLAEYRVQHKDGFWCILEAVTTNLLADPSVQGIVINGHDVTEQKLTEEQLLHNSLHDALTQLPNRALFMDRLGQVFGRSRRHLALKFAVLFVDLDRFKVINDSQGHQTGDILLILIAQRLQNAIRPGDTVARLGSDEFVILLEEIRDISDAIQMARHLQRVIEKPLDLGEHEISITASIGIALNHQDYQWPGDLLRDADIAMTWAKVKGKARYEIFTSAMHTKAVELMQLEHELRRSLEQLDISHGGAGEPTPFQVYYQPIISLENGTIAGFEALVRWLRPQQGLINPGKFIPLAEETGLILPLGQWVLQEACHQMVRWQREFLTENWHFDDTALSKQFPGSPIMQLTMAVNLSGRQFAQPELLEQIQQVLQVTGLDPHCLKLEITESVVMQNCETAAQMLTQLRELGIQLSIDDFGTGYSSLSYLHQFPINTLKVDRSFVSCINASGENSEIVRAIIMLAHSLGMNVVAEGIETSHQLSLLRKLGCEYGQGYFFSRPVDLAAAGKLLNPTVKW